MMQQIRKTLSICIPLLWIASTAAIAQEFDLVELDSTAPSEVDIIKALTPQPPAEKPRAIALHIQFELDSYELTHATRESLNNVGSALISNALSAYRFRVEGHADSTGGEDYNLLLSAKRADGVRNYLINIFEMSQDRLESVGRGERSLINPDAPASAENQVVLIINLGPDDS